MCDFDNIKNLVDSAIGEPKRDYCSSDGWYEYNCPVCASEVGHPDGKFNLAVRIDEGSLWCHCWKCGYHGKLARLFRDFGSIELFNQYKEAINAIRESRYYEIQSGDFTIDGGINNDLELELPNGFHSLNEYYYGCNEALAYLKSRGITKDIISKYNIGFIGLETDNYSLRNRIVIPSYNNYDDLTYWVARDYTGKNKIKILNPKVDKKTIVFNEGLINWYEPITLVEGPFDHIVVPNSIPLLGKSLNEDYEIYNMLINKSKSYINIFLDEDAVENAYKLYTFLNDTQLNGRIRMIKCPKDKDASDIYQNYGKNGIISLLRKAYKISEFELSMKI